MLSNRHSFDSTTEEVTGLSYELAPRTTEEEDSTCKKIGNLTFSLGDVAAIELGIWAGFNLTSILYVPTIYSMFYIAPEFMKLAKDVRSSFEAAGYVEPQLTTAINQEMAGYMWTVIEGLTKINMKSILTKIPDAIQVQNIFFTAEVSALIAAGVLVYIYTSIILASYAGLTPGLNPQLSKGKEEAVIREEARVHAENNLELAGGQAGKKKPDHARYYYGHWLRQPLPENPTLLQYFAYGMIELPHAIPQDFWYALGMTLRFGLSALVVFTLYIMHVGLIKYVNEYNTWMKFYNDAGTCDQAVIEAAFKLAAIEAASGEKISYADSFSQLARFIKASERMASITVENLQGDNVDHCEDLASNYAYQALVYRVNEVMTDPVVYRTVCAALAASVVLPFMYYYAQAILNYLLTCSFPKLSCPTISLSSLSKNNGSADVKQRGNYTSVNLTERLVKDGSANITGRDEETGDAVRNPVNNPRLSGDRNSFSAAPAGRVDPTTTDSEEFKAALEM